MKQKVLIISDLEGIIGVKSLDDVLDNEFLLYKEVSIAFDFYKKALDAEIYFCYCHDRGIAPKIIKKNYPEVIFIQHLWNIDFSIKYDFAILLGFHDKSRGKGIFPHSFRVEISKIVLSEKIVGEIEVIIELLRLNKVPSILVSADKITLDTVYNPNLIKHIITIGNLENDEKCKKKSYDNLLICFKQSIELINTKNLLCEDRLQDSHIKIELEDKIDKLMSEHNISLQREFNNATEFIKYSPLLAKQLNCLEGIRRELIIREIRKFNYMDPSLIQKDYPRLYSILQKDAAYLYADQLEMILKKFKEIADGKESLELYSIQDLSKR